MINATLRQTFSGFLLPNVLGKISPKINNTIVIIIVEANSNHELKITKLAKKFTETIANVVLTMLLPINKVVTVLSKFSAKYKANESD